MKPTIHTKSSVSVCVALSCTLLHFGCAGDATLSEEEGKGFGAPPETFQDPNGTQWELVGPIEYVSDDADETDNDESGDAPEASTNGKPSETASDTADEKPDIESMSLEELAELWRPHLDHGGYEYVMNKDDALELAKVMRAELRNPTRTQGDGEPPVGKARKMTPLPELREPRSVYDGESRFSINSYADNYPYNNNAAMYGAGFCSAFKLINHHTAITSAHCVHTGSSWKTRKKIRFQAGSPNPLGELPRYCYDMVVPGGWDGDTVSYDYALLRLSSDDAGCNFDDYDVGYYGWRGVSNCTTSIGAYVASYPGENDSRDMEPPGNWTYPTMFYDWRGDGWTSCPTYPDRLWHYIDTSEGQSGAAVVSYYSSSGEHRVRGIHSGYWNGVFDNSNQARRMDSSLVSWFESNAGY